jgi:hypothetical protein
MRFNSQFGGNAAQGAGDVDELVRLLEGRHGVWAADVAEFFATLHGLSGNAGRSLGWAAVAEFIRHRAEVRLNEGDEIH